MGFVFVVALTLPAVSLRIRACSPFIILFSDLYMLNLKTLTKCCSNTKFFNLPESCTHVSHDDVLETFGVG